MTRKTRPYLFYDTTTALCDPGAILQIVPDISECPPLSSLSVET